jgi:hypothetical protein
MRPDFPASAAVSPEAATLPRRSSRLVPEASALPSRRPPSWGQPAGDEPIIDAARIPLGAFGTGRSRRRTLAMYLWLRVLRPSLTLAVWFFAVWYAWPYVLGMPSQPEVQNLLSVYAAMVGGILVLMLLIAPLRQLQRRRERAPEDREPSSLFALATYIEVPPLRLLAWQLTKQLIVRHKPDGHLEDAQDLGISRP